MLMTKPLKKGIQHFFIVLMLCCLYNQKGNTKNEDLFATVAQSYVGEVNRLQGKRMICYAKQ